MSSILFVCTSNQFRSPIAAEAFSQQLILDNREDWDVNSAGTWTSSGRHVSREALSAARALGFDIEDHITRLLDQGMLEDADIVLVMEQGHKESIQVEFPFARKKTFLLSQVTEGVSYDIPDPEGSLEDAVSILGDLVEMVQDGADKIYDLVENVRE